MTIVKQCNPKLYRPDKICNKKTGRWVLKTSKLGKQLMAFINKTSPKPKPPSPKPKTLSPKPKPPSPKPKTLSPKPKPPSPKPNINEYSLTSLFGKLNLNNKINKRKKKNIFLSSFAKIQKPKIDIYSMNFVGKSTSRTKAQMYRVALKHSNPNSIIKKYGNKETHHLHSFVKITPLRKVKKNPIQIVKNSPTVKEIELFRITNMLQDDNILDTVAYCLNDKLLRSDWAMFDSRFYSFLTTEDLKDYTPFYNQRFKTVPFDIILQLLYTFHCFEHIGLKHMDLHMWNFYVKRRKRPVNLQYEMKIFDNYENFYIQSMYKIKIIDFDGGSKVAVRGTKDKYSKTISNPKIFSGITNGKYAPSHKTNFLKLMHSLVRYNQIRMKTLNNYHDTMYKYKESKLTNNNGNVPFLSREYVPNVLPNSHKYKVTEKLGPEKILKKAYNASSGQYAQSLLRTYGFYGTYFKHYPRFFHEIPRTMIRPLSDVLMDMKLSGIFQPILPAAVKFSQRGLFK
jgi:hypothetical protein